MPTFATERTAAILRDTFDGIGKDLSIDYGGTIQHLWIDFELISFPESKRPFAFRYQKRVGGSIFKLTGTRVPVYENVGHYSVRPDFYELSRVPHNSVANYALSLIYESTSVLLEKKKKLGGFDAEKFRAKFLASCQERGFEISPIEITRLAFVAMEYYGLILNRTYRVTLKNETLDGVVCRGLTGVDGGNDPLTRLITSKLAVHGPLEDTASFIDDKVINRPNRANFTIPLSEINLVEYNPSKKWGMGYYPHDGRVTIGTGSKKRELIILGSQSGKEIADRLTAFVDKAKKAAS